MKEAMHRMSSSLAMAAALLCAPEGVEGAPRQQGYGQDSQLQEVRDTLADMRYSVSNHEQEIRTLDEKLTNLDTIIEGLRDQVSDTSKAHKEQLKGSANALETRISALESASKGLVADLRQFKTHANDTAVAIGQYKQKIGELEKVIESQNQNIEHLQAALKSLMEAIQGKEIATAADVAEAGDGSTYRIKNGDSLEKIARAHQTTVQALKDLNGLTSDRIVVGKILKIPQK